MSSLPSVSIVLPVLDARGMIEAAVETWLSQTYEGDFSLMVWRVNRRYPGMDGWGFSTH